MNVRSYVNAGYYLILSIICEICATICAGRDNVVKFIVLIKETNNFDEINNFFMNNYWNKIENFMKFI